MKSNLTLFLLTVVLLAACAPGASATQPPLAQPVAGASNPMPVPSTEGAPLPTEMVATQTYTDPDYGFAFDYPAEWMLDVIVLGDRAPHSIQLTSWTHEPGQIAEVQPGGTVINVVVQLWDPKGDLDAFVEQRIQGWDPAAIVAREMLALPDGRVAQAFVLRAVDGESYFLFALLGDQYLVISGSGDIEAIRQVAHSLR